jgi:hypothetical protein
MSSNLAMQPPQPFYSSSAENFFPVKGSKSTGIANKETMTRLQPLCQQLPKLFLPSLQGPALTAFSLFLKLPIEIRHMIWKHAAMVSRTIELPSNLTANHTSSKAGLQPSCIPAKSQEARGGDTISVALRKLQTTPVLEKFLTSSGSTLPWIGSLSALTVQPILLLNWKRRPSILTSLCCIRFAAWESLTIGAYGRTSCYLRSSGYLNFSNCASWRLLPECGRPAVAAIYGRRQSSRKIKCIKLQRKWLLIGLRNF